MLTDIITIFKKEFNGYFRSRLGYFIILIYAVLVLLATFFGTPFLQNTGSALVDFFKMQNTALLLLIPAITMKLWTDEQRQGTLELLLSQPVSVTAMVLGKFLAAWGLSAVLLLITLGTWFLSAQNLVLDNTAVLINYGACLLMAGALCSVCAVVSALSSHAITSFIVSLLLCFMLSSINYEYLLHKANISSEILMRSSQVLNFEQHFENIISGQLTFANIFYYVSFTVLTLWFNVVAVEFKRS